ncbi:hypothetical protein STUTZSP0542_05370 [Stutzerimonas marianensis]
MGSIVVFLGCLWCPIRSAGASIIAFAACNRVGLDYAERRPSRGASKLRLSPSLMLVLLLVACTATSYEVRFALMEDPRWVGLCAESASHWACQLRAGLGWLIHMRVLAWSALCLALLAFFLPRRTGWWLAALGLLLAVPALVLYSASLAVFAVVIAALRLVRAPRAALTIDHA